MSKLYIVTYADRQEWTVADDAEAARNAEILKHQRAVEQERFVIESATERLARAESLFAAAHSAVVTEDPGKGIEVAQPVA